MEQEATLSPVVDLGRSVNNIWTATPLNDLHNLENSAQVQRLREKHLGEDDVIEYRRAKGQLEVTRGEHTTAMWYFFWTQGWCDVRKERRAASRETRNDLWLFRKIWKPRHPAHLWQPETQLFSPRLSRVLLQHWAMSAIRQKQKQVYPLFG